MRVLKFIFILLGVFLILEDSKANICLTDVTTSLIKSSDESIPLARRAAPGSKLNFTYDEIIENSKIVDRDTRIAHYEKLIENRLERKLIFSPAQRQAILDAHEMPGHLFDLNYSQLAARIRKLRSAGIDDPEVIRLGLNAGIMGRFDAQVKPGAFAILPDNTPVRIKSVDDGKVSGFHQLSSSIFSTTMDKVVPAVKEHSGVRVNDRVLSKDGIRYDVKEVYADGRLHVKYADSWNRSTVNTSMASKKVGSYKNAKPGMKVMDHRGQVYFIKEVYSDGRLYVEYYSSYNKSIINYHQCGLPVDELRGIKPGLKVIDGDNHELDVKAVFDNGKAWTEFRASWNKKNVPVEELGVEVKQLMGLKRNSMVQIGSHSYKAIRLYDNGKVVLNNNRVEHIDKLKYEGKTSLSFRQSDDSLSLTFRKSTLGEREVLKEVEKKIGPENREEALEILQSLNVDSRFRRPEFLNAFLELFSRRAFDHQQAVSLLRTWKRDYSSNLERTIEKIKKDNLSGEEAVKLLEQEQAKIKVLEDLELGLAYEFNEAELKWWQKLFKNPLNRHFDTKQWGRLFTEYANGKLYNADSKVLDELASRYGAKGVDKTPRKGRWYQRIRSQGDYSEYLQSRLLDIFAHPRLKDEVKDAHLLYLYLKKKEGMGLDMASWREAYPRLVKKLNFSEMINSKPGFDPQEALIAYKDFLLKHFHDSAALSSRDKLRVLDELSPSSHDENYILKIHSELAEQWLAGRRLERLSSDDLDLLALDVTPEDLAKIIPNAGEISDVESLLSIRNRFNRLAEIQELSRVDQLIKNRDYIDNLFLERHFGMQSRKPQDLKLLSSLNLRAESYWKRMLSHQLSGEPNVSNLIKELNFLKGKEKFWSFDGFDTDEFLTDVTEIFKRYSGEDKKAIMQQLMRLDYRGSPLKIKSSENFPQFLAEVLKQDYSTGLLESFLRHLDGQPEKQIELARIAIENISLDDFKHLAETLSLTKRKLPNSPLRKEIVDLIWEKTKGNPDILDSTFAAKVGRHLPEIRQVWVSHVTEPYVPDQGAIKTLIKYQDEVDISFEKTLDHIIEANAPPEGWSNWGDFIAQLPTSKQPQFVTRLLERQGDSTDNVTNVIGQLHANEANGRAIANFFNASDLFNGNRTSFSQNQVVRMFRGGRFKQFFPWVHSAGLEGAIRTRFILGARSVPGNRENRINDDWIRSKLADDSFSDAFPAVLGFRPARNFARLSGQLSTLEDLSGGGGRFPADMQDQLRGLTVQGIYENNGYGIMRTGAGRGADQVEDTAPQIRRRIERSFNQGELQNADPLVQRLFVANWGLNANGGLINDIRNRAIRVANNDNDFWDLRVEIHNFPTHDTLRRTRNYYEGMGDGDNKERLGRLISDIESFLGVSGSRGESIEDITRGLPLSEGNQNTLLAEAFSGYQNLRGEERLEALSKARQQFLEMKAKGNDDFKNMNAMRGDQVLAERAMLEASQSIKNIGVVVDDTSLNAYINLAERILAHVEHDFFLNPDQIRFIKQAVNKVKSDSRLTLDQKVNQINDLLNNAVDQAYYKVDREFGRFDLPMHSLVRIPRGAEMPAHAGDVIMRSHNVFLLSQLVDKVSELRLARKGIVHRIGDTDVQKPAEVFNPGTSTGVLRIDKDPMQLSENEIGVFSKMPAETSALAGIITLGVGARLSHLQLLAKSLKIPNVRVSSDFLDHLRKLEGKNVVVSTEKSGKISITEVVGGDETRKLASSSPITIPKPNHTITKPLSFDDASKVDVDGVVAGPKGIQLSRMRQANELSAHVPDGFILPFGFFNRYVEKIGLDQWINLLGNTKLNNKELVAMIAGKVRAIIHENPIPEEMLNEVITHLEGLQKRTGNEEGYFFRSDTNIEDLPNFNGAGLNESVPNVRIDKEAVDQAIREVWASPFKEKSIFWRGMALADETVAIAEPSVVVMPTVKAESSGVLLSKGIDQSSKLWTSGRGNISANWGIGSVVEAGLPVEEISLMGESPIRHSFTVSYRKPSAKADGGIEMIEVQPGHPVLTEEQITTLNQFGKKIEAVLGDEDHGWDIEWAFDHKGDIQVLQARPNM